MFLENIDIRLVMSECGFKYRDLAKVMGVGANYLSRIMRNPLSNYHREKILQAIEKLKDNERQGDQFA